MYTGRSGMSPPTPRGTSDSALDAGMTHLDPELVSSALQLTARILRELQDDFVVPITQGDAPPHPDVFLGEGYTGVALFMAYAAREGMCTSESALHCLRHAITVLANVRASVGLMSGLNGLGWAVQHIQGLLCPDSEDSVSEIDELLLQWLSRREGWYEAEIMYGLAGVAVYALERLPRPAAWKCLELVISKLQHAAIRSPAGTTWPTRLPIVGDDHPNYEYRLGMAHGVAGIAAVLARVYSAFDGDVRVLALLEGAVQWILSHIAPPITDNVTGGYSGLRPSWCWGDLGIASALLSAALRTGNEKWLHEALRIARCEARRDPARRNTTDASLCHGSAGLVQMLGRFHAATGEDVFIDSVQRWLKATLEHGGGTEGIGGFRFAWGVREGQPEWRSAPGLLAGSAGVGLSLLSAISMRAPRLGSWDCIFAMGGEAH